MRTPSLFFVLLLTAATLPAQVSPAGSPAVFSAPPAASACPVRLTVDRRADSGIIETSTDIIETSTDASWVAKHSALGLDELQAALRREPGFTSLSGREQQQRLDHITQLYRRLHGQGLVISFTQPKAQIVSADLVVHGYPSGTRVIPATPLAPAEITETVHLTSSPGQPLPLFKSSIWMTHVTVVDWVELTRIGYADGTSWQPSIAQQCAATPSLFVPVASAQ
jgi:hypothetical protein